MSSIPPPSDQPEAHSRVGRRSASRPRRFYFLLVCWGKEFCDYICRFLIPSLLAPGNIAALRYPGDAKLLLVTTREDWLRLNREPIFRRLRELIPVEAFWDESIPRKGHVHKYQRMSHAHAALAHMCYEDGAFAVNLTADTIYPDGCIAEGQRLVLDEAKDVVLCAAIRFDQDGIVAELEKRGFLEPGKPIVLDMREAVAVGLRNLHPESLASEWTAQNFGRLHPQHARHYFLTCCIWRAPNEDTAFLVTHNWSPLIVNYSVLREHDISALDGRAIDGPYIFQNFPRHTEQIHIVLDSDSLFLLGMTPRSEMAPTDDREWFSGWGRFEEWTKGLILSRTVHDTGIDPYRRAIYAKPVCWHAADRSRNWDATERQVRRLISEYVETNIEAPGADRRIGRRLWYALIRRVVR